MERIREKRLPPIFKMSVLWNILPYYGHLHRWKRLLEKINTETKDIWDQNREQLKYIGRDFKRDIELDKVKQSRRRLRPKRSWLDLFSLSLSHGFNCNKFNFTTLTSNLSEDEVIIIDSHDDIFKDYQVYYWRKDRISDILPAIKCPSFKSETKIFKTSEKYKIEKLIYNQNHVKSIVIEKSDKNLSINLAYGNTVKIAPWTFRPFHQYEFFNKLKERYELWEIDGCACKPKKIRTLVNRFLHLDDVIWRLKRFSSINDAKLWIYMNYVDATRSFSKYDTMFFNHPTKWMSYEDTNFMFSGDSLAVVRYRDYYNFRLDERINKSKDSYIRGRI